MDKVTDPARVVTDQQVIDHLKELGIDPDYVEFYKDYSKDYPHSKLYRDLKTGKRTVVISGLDRYNKFGHRMIPRWYKNRLGYYVGGANHLICRAAPDGTTDVWDGEGKHTRWAPRVFLDGVEQKLGEVSLLPVDPVNENYQENTLVWDYGICKRRLRLIEGIIAEWFVFDKDPGGDVRIESGAVGGLPAREYFAIDDDGNQLDGFKADSAAKFVPHAAFEGAVYPVVVDDSYTGYSSASDGYIEYCSNSSASSTRAATSGTVRASYTFLYAYNAGDDDDFVRRVFLFFNTSSIPVGATLDSAVLYLYGQYNDWDSGKIYKNNGAYPHNPLTGGDFDRSHYTVQVGSWSRTGTGYHSCAINVSAIEAATTRLVYRVSSDVSGLDAQWANRFYSCEKGSGYQPKLVVTYTVSTPPTVSTQAVSSIDVDSATGNGNITDDGNASITARGMIWKAGADPVDIASCDDYSDEGAGGVGAFSSLMTGLSPGTLYYCRAYAINSEGTSYGSAVSFTTLSPTPITKPLDADALLRGLGLRAVNVDAGVRGTENGAIDVDALLRVCKELGFAGDTALLQTIEQAFATDALVRATVKESFEVDATVRDTLVRELESDALLKFEASDLLSSDAVLRLSRILGVSADTVITALPIAQLTGTALLLKALSQTSRADVALALQPSVALALDALLSAEASESVVSNVLLRSAAIVSAAASVGLCGTDVGQLVSDALLLASCEKSIYSDALLRLSVASVHTFDAVLALTGIGVVDGSVVLVAPSLLGIDVTAAVLDVMDTCLDGDVFIASPPLLVGRMGFSNRSSNIGFSGREIDTEVQ